MKTKPLVDYIEEENNGEAFRFAVGRANGKEKISGNPIFKKYLTWQKQNFHTYWQASGRL
ncbi:MAG: hypothetical protein LBB18_03300 [Puniceicoccales bacterium]|jgi:hypothetical protein|nr:hypothetical protein [Puniceicoccales bacterium]